MAARSAGGLAVIALVVGALGGGCASVDVAGSGWSKSGAGVQQVTLDEMDCARASQDAGRTRDLILGGVFDVARLAIENTQEQRAFEGCMSGRGYRQAAARSDRTRGSTSRS